MSKMTTVLVRVRVITILILTTIATSASPVKSGTGDEWISWSPEQRNAFVDGFWTGYAMGSRRACDATNDLWEVGKVHRIGDDPSARCLAHIDVYSKDPRSYAAVLTDFYTLHPQYRNIPVIYLMRFLADSKFETADGLYQMALKGELRTVF